jgi:hypothetical protein
MKKYLKQGIIFLILVVLLYFALFKNLDMLEIKGVIKSTNKAFIILGLISMFLYIFGEAVNLKMLLKTLGYRVNLGKAVKYALVGFFYSSITPSASGGQPMQVYYMHKDDISVAHSSLALMVELCIFEVVSIIYLVIGFLKHFNYLTETLNSIGILFCIGITLNFIVAVFLILVIFSKKASNTIFSVLKKIIRLFKLKNENSILDNLDKEKENYLKGSSFLKKNKSLFLKMFIVTFMQFSFHYMIPYFTYRSLGLNSMDIFSMITLNAVMFSSISSLPIPGSVGASEGAFILLYKPIFGINLIDGAMILYRFISFYFFVIFSGIMLFLIELKGKYKTSKY